MPTPESMRQSQTIKILKDENEHLRLQFGSCWGMDDFETKIFQTMALPNNRPDVFIWLADVNYVDKSHIFNTAPMSAQHVEMRYTMTLNDPGYHDLKQHAKIIGVWDDHDFGGNNADKTFKAKD